LGHCSDEISTFFGSTRLLLGRANALPEWEIGVYYDSTTFYCGSTMNRYNIGRKLGEGSFGTVFYAKKKRSGEEVRFVEPVCLWNDGIFVTDTILRLRITLPACY
jgi:hypothetical protein